MRAKLLFLASALVSNAVAPLGCGSLDGHTGTPGTLATVQGKLVDPSLFEIHNDVRVAVVWRNPDGRQAQIQYIVSQDLPVQPVFPSRFVLQLDGPPPAAALAVQPGLDLPIAEGVVVAYEDLNGNGKLDLVSDDAGAFIDRIVGTNEDTFLIYIGGPIPPKFFQTPQGSVGTPMPGYNIVRAPTVTCGGSDATSSTGSSSGAGSSSSSGAGSQSNSGTGSTSSSGSESSSSSVSDSGAGPRSGAGSSSGAGSDSAPATEAGALADQGLAALDGGGPCTPPPAEWLPMTTPYDLTVSSDPRINQVMCQNGGSGVGISSGSSSVAGGWNVTTLGTPPDGYPSPTDPGLNCQGSTGYFYQRCVTMQQSICEPSMTNCTSVQIDLGSGPPPPGWPCP